MDSADPAFSQQECNEYLQSKNVSSLFVQIVQSMLIEKPDDPILFTYEYLQSKFPDICKPPAPAAASSPPAAETSSAPEANAAAAEDSDDDDDDYDDNFELKEYKGSKAAVVATVEKVADDWKPPVFDKTDVQAEMLRQRVKGILFMKHLGDKDVDTLVKAFELKKFAVEDVLMKQGDEGDCFYVLEEGITDVLIDNVGKVAEKDGKGENNFVGELALLYNAPRSATIVAQTAVTAWALDRTTFKTIMMESSKGETESKLAFLAKVQLLDPLSEQEKLQLSDSLKSKSYAEGDIIIKEGDTGDEMYIIEEGTVICTKNTDGVEVNCSPELGPGNFFGELALLNDQARQATVKALSKLSVLSIDRATFKRVLGPLQDILKEAQKQYESGAN